MAAAAQGCGEAGLRGGSRGAGLRWEELQAGGWLLLLPCLSVVILLGEEMVAQRLLLKLLSGLWRPRQHGPTDTCRSSTCRSSSSAAWQQWLVAPAGCLRPAAAC